MNSLFIIAVIFGIMSGIANIPQVYKIFKRKSAKNISILTSGFLFLGAVVLVFYGISTKSLPVLITNILGTVNLGLIVLGWFLYRRKK